MSSNGKKESEDGPQEILLEKAHLIADHICKNSTVFNDEQEAMYPRFHEYELKLGKVLGRGGFCVVNEIKAIDLAENDTKGLEGHEDDRRFMKSHCIRDGDARYAIKKLSDDIHDDNDRFVKGVIDLAIEVKYLAVIEHPHIIKMRAVADRNPYNVGFFIVLDRLYDTLDRRFRKWNQQKAKYKGVFGSIRDFKGDKKKDLMIDKLTVAYDLASALNYLHSLNIIYRDMKPDNIGFDVRGDVKIFDFGLAKELRPEKQADDGTYKLTGFTGSLRYMAPEVANSLPYEYSVDVYSYGIIFWQIISCLVPYKGYSLKMHEDLVINRGYRPKVRETWPQPWQDLMKNCWSPNRLNRPTFQDILSILREEICRLRDDDGDLELDISRKSALSN